MPDIEKLREYLANALALAEVCKLNGFAQAATVHWHTAQALQKQIDAIEAAQG
jgi:hypothetical protein